MLTTDPHRGTGRTTRQILAAPIGAFYLVPNSAGIKHTRNLAAKHGRSDLQVICLAELEPERWIGRIGITGLVIDHYVSENMVRTDIQLAALEIIRTRIGRK